MKDIMICQYLPVILLLAASIPLHGEPDGGVTFESLLGEMLDRDRLATLPAPAYTCRQFSSYDRASVSPDEASTWFANADFSQFLRTEKSEGKTRHVMMDVAGPGAIVRFWATWVHRPGNILRIYLDGAAEPVVEAPLARFIDGEELTGPPLAEGVSPGTRYDRRGHNLYLPIPYARHCKITCEGPVKGSLYYQINYRTYAPGTAVKTFRREDPKQSRTALAHVQRRLIVPETTTADCATTELGGILDPGAARTARIAGPAAIRKLVLQLRAGDLGQALRSTVLEIAFDGERTVWCPVGDFFGTGHQLHPSRTWNTSVAEGGAMASYWVMPFEKSAEVIVHNFGTQPVDLVLGDISHSPWAWNQRSMHFHSTWHELWHKTVGGPEDANFVTIRGRGVYVGDTLTLFNPVAKWWGEGDEKIYVDDEEFPSHFGTGTEDYYGYAWCRPEPFSAPFHAQPSGRGNLSPGMSVNSRYRSLDAIPFTTALKFDMELWHWAKTRINYAPATFWYARPGAASNVGPDPAAAARPVARSTEDLVPVPHLEGAIEGESLPVKEHSGGTTEVQTASDWGWSGLRQLWWKDAKPGDRLVLTFPAGKAGRQRVLAHLTKAPDYGIHRILINGTLAKEIDLYHPEVIRVPVDLGIHDLHAGPNRLEIIVTGANQQAEKRYMFGLDCLINQALLPPIENQPILPKR